MIFDIGGRQSGKTYRMLQWLVANPEGVLIVHSRKEADRLTAIHPQIGEHQIITMAQSANLQGRSNETKVIIDNVDMVMQQLISREIVRMSATGIVE